MDRLNLLIVEGNTKEANSGFKKAGCESQSENFKKHIEMYEPNSKIDITEPCDDASMSKIISSLENVDVGKIIDRIKYNIKIKYFTNES